MQKNKWNSLLPLLLFALFVFPLSSCSKKKEKENLSAAPAAQDSEQKIEYYTCSMHPFIHMDKPGKCPICGMTLVPVYAGSHKDHGLPESSASPSAVQLSAEKLQRIGVTTVPVERKTLTREIDIPGRVAFNPDLLLAQNEYLIARQSSSGALGGLQGGLVNAAKLRLKMMGMSDAQISDLSRKGKAQTSLLVPQKGDAVWIYGSVFESDLPWVKPGDRVRVFLPGFAEEKESVLESIDPALDPMTRTAQVRLRLPNAGGELKSELFVRLKIEAKGGEGLAIPENAVLDTGVRQIAFVEKGEGRIESRNLKLGRRGNDVVEVLSGLSEGERVVTHANFLIDSESKLKGSPAGEHPHEGPL
ncbi:MAG: efflux RND transporter periplasmic adaptor subunit [bacterium]